MATVAQLKEQLAKARDELAQLNAEIESRYQQAEIKTDSFLQRLIASRFTALIVGAAIGVAGSVYLIVC